MNPRRLVLPLSVLAGLFLVAGVAMAGVLLRGTGADEPNLALTSPTPATETAPQAIPEPLRLRLEAMPPHLQEDALHRFEDGSIDLDGLEALVRAFEEHSYDVQLSIFVAANDSAIVVDTYPEGEQLHVDISPETQYLRSSARVALADLQPDEMVIVYFDEDGRTAVAVQALGLAP